MAGQLNSFTVTSLYGRFDVTLPIVNNRIILVGANGLGKSTCINALYYLLSRQWSRLAEIDFDSVVLGNSIGDITLTKAEVESFALPVDTDRVPQVFVRQLLTRLDQNTLSEFVEASASEIGRFRKLQGLDFPPGLLLEVQGAVRAEIKKGGPLHRAAEIVRELLGNDQILYLPTYRRIEKDLKALIPDREEPRRYRGEQEVIRRFGFRTDAYAELVEFGMEDVKTRLADTLSALNDNNRKEFSALAGSYLRDVINGEGGNYSSEEMRKLSEEDVSKILRRVEENTLSQREKNLLTQAIGRLRSDTASESDAYVAHFLSKLVRSGQNLTKREKPVTDFVKTCNSYLDDKEFVYDELSYRIFVREIGQGGREIELPHLSSGEKQVVSLFAHLYLTDRKYFIVIDEPELSLSVKWQKTFLPDIWNSGNCSYLAAVTHSPFIFDNDFEKYTFDMKDGMRRNG